jgi:hypothetical protein
VPDRHRRAIAECLVRAAAVVEREPRVDPGAGFAADRRQIEDKNLAAYHKGQREFLQEEKELRITWRREQIRAANRPKWAALYKRQNAEMRLHKKNLKFGFYRLRQFFKDRGKGQSVLTGAIKAFVGRTDLTKSMAARHETERKALAKEVRAQNREAIRQENAAYREELDHLKQLQAQETRTLREAHAKQSQDLAREMKQRADAREDPSETRRSETLREEFQKRVGRRIRKARKRGGRGKDHGLGRA